MLLTVSVVVVAIMMVITCIVFIIALFYIIRAVKSIHTLAETVRPHIAPISHDITQITQRASAVIESIQRQTLMIEESVASFRNFSSSVKRFQENFLAKVTLPATKLPRLFSAVKVGVETFVNKMFHRDNSSN